MIGQGVTERTVDTDIHTTAGGLALGNLDAQIEGLEMEATLTLSLPARTTLVELLGLRGHLLGRIADYESAESWADRLVHDHPDDGDSHLARARARAQFHRFAEALADLHEAEQRGADPASVNGERATIFQAVGDFDKALAIYNDAVDRRVDFHSLGDLATLHADRGEILAAERCFRESRARFRGVSPIPLAQLDFKRGHMWMREGDLSKARRWFETSVGRLPGYAPAAGHLAEVEAVEGARESAIARLLPLTESSDDPDYSAQLARILADVGRVGEADAWRRFAAQRYNELVGAHLEAFADHAAEFWLEVGKDPIRALWLAKQNFAVRPTSRAQDLVARARKAVREGGPRTHASCS